MFSGYFLFHDVSSKFSRVPAHMCGHGFLIYLTKKNVTKRKKKVLVQTCICACTTLDVGMQPVVCCMSPWVHLVLSL